MEKDEEGLYSIKYEGQQKVLADHAYVISSPLELSTFEGKSVSVSGEFISGNKQCVMSNCKNLSSNWTGVKIESVTLK
jgi:hypothetical protein